MVEVRKIHEKLENFMALIVLIQSIPVLGGFLKATFGEVKKSSSESGRTEIKDSGKGLGENLVISVMRNELDAGQEAQLEQLEDDLSTDPDRGKDRLVAFQVYLAKLIKDNSRQKKKTKKAKAGENEPEEETSSNILGVSFGKAFVLRVLAKTTYSERKKVLEREGVFSEMPKSHNRLIRWSRNNKFETLIILLLSPFVIFKIIIWLLGG